jgi:hypothetical protein
VIETTISQVAADLLRRGLDPDDRIAVTIEPDTAYRDPKDDKFRIKRARICHA